MSCQTSWPSLVLNMAGQKYSLFQLTTTTWKGRWESSGVSISRLEAFAWYANFGTLVFLGPASFARVCIDSDKMRYCSLAQDPRRKSRIWRRGHLR